MYFIASNYRRNNIIMFSLNWTNNVLQNSVTNHNDDRGLPAAQSSNKDILVWCELQDPSLVCTLICWDTTTTAKFLISHHPGHLHWSYRDLPVHISNLSLACFFIFHTFFFDKQYRFLLLFRILFLIFLLLMWTDPVKILTSVNIFCLFHSMFSYVSWYFFGLTKVFTYRDLF